MAETEYRGRRAAFIENENVRVTVLQEGGHIAEIFGKAGGVNPLWTPPWPSVELSGYDPAQHRVYGAGAEAKLLAGIMGHNLCLDIFGGPSDEEAAAGLTVHGEASVAPYQIEYKNAELAMTACLSQAQLLVERRIRLLGSVVEISETVENLAATDRPVGWTQHVTLGPPFLENGATRFETSATRSKVFEASFGAGDYMKTGAEFDWPHAPRADGGAADLRTFTDAPVSAAYTAHLMDPARARAFFVAWSPASKTAFGYVWRQSDFPWMGIWEENRSRTQAPWNGSTVARGMEFGVSPMPETRRRMVERGRMFGVPCFRWIPARARVSVEYRAAIAQTGTAPAALAWNEAGEVRFV
jgi:hypothetical protein